ncbi:GTPase domain-containing protein [Tardiphaga sp. 709]|uniref:GTPase domain-containing protein n=1 Tax=Tardiphaga sp. 709 TaxID=3076039 RepID=UPI0028EE5115|nr:GTPase domain-containing protein [Tardiphaga sp. 709]WNV09015.1 GTPase domain-containing protein [Tardiphaga sp. 709]
MTGILEPFTVATSYELIKIAKREGWLKQLIDLARRKNHALLLGSTGAGKTQFLRSTNEIISPAISPAARTEFATVGRFEINDSLFDLIDTPGQLEHRPRRDAETKEAIKQKLHGIINFVSYGFHEYGVPLQDVISGEQVKPEYLQEHQKREIDLIAEWAPLMSTEWVLTVVTKADIWWDSRETVAQHYQGGAYQKRLARLFPNAHHIVRPYSSISSRFYGTIPGSGSFDDSVRSACRAEVFRVLAEAAKAGTKRK